MIVVPFVRRREQGAGLSRLAYHTGGMLRLTSLKPHRRAVDGVGRFSSSGLIEAAESELVGPVQKRMRSFEDRSLLVLVIAASLALAWILLPFYGLAIRRSIRGVRRDIGKKIGSVSRCFDIQPAWRFAYAGYAFRHPIIFAEQIALS
jgi:hypothetical protein